MMWGLLDDDSDDGDDEDDEGRYLFGVFSACRALWQVALLPLPIGPSQPPAEVRSHPPLLAGEESDAWRLCDLPKGAC